MALALLIMRVLLAAVFGVAGLAKLADRAGSQRALRDFGLPALLVTSGSVLLPLAELIVAVALLPTLSAWWGALGALTLLLLFVAGISYNLVRGRQPECHCFGQLHSVPAGWPTLIRNLVLAAEASFVVGFQQQYARENPLSRLGILSVLERLELVAGLLLLALVALGGWVLLQVLRQQGRLLLRIEALEDRLASGEKTSPSLPGAAQLPPLGGLPVGMAAPAFTLPDLDGKFLTLGTLCASGNAVVLLFTDPGCDPCNALLTEIGRWRRDYTGKLVLALISRGSAEANHAKVSGQRITQVLLQKDREVAEAYQAYATPSAVLVQPDGSIGSPLAVGAGAIRGLVAGAVGLPVLRGSTAKMPLL